MHNIQIDSRSHGNLIPFQSLELYSPGQEQRLCTLQKQLSSSKSIQSNIEQLGLCTVGLRLQEKIARCRFFVAQQMTQKC